MKKFTEIRQYRHIIEEIQFDHDYKGKDENNKPIYIHTSDYPILSFKGTVKLDGTNSSIVKYSDNTYKFQSRERELSLEQDNMSFMTEIIKTDYKKLFDNIVFNDYCAIYGEWCGRGIQKGMAISKLPHMFVIFAVNIDGEYKNIENYSHLKIESQNIFNILQFQTFDICIDFNNPALSQGKLTELTDNIEKRCPVGAYFGVDGEGEGIVWTCYYKNKKYSFKTKGKKHQSSKTKNLVPTSVENIENINKFIEYSVTENRLKQGISKMKELNIPLETESTSEYLRWVYNDIIKEETDAIKKNNIDTKKLGKYISIKARKYWFDFLENNPLS